MLRCQRYKSVTKALRRAAPYPTGHRNAFPTQPFLYAVPNQKSHPVLFFFGAQNKAGFRLGFGWVFYNWRKNRRRHSSIYSLAEKRKKKARPLRNHLGAPLPIARSPYPRQKSKRHHGQPQAIQKAVTHRWPWASSPMRRPTTKKPLLLKSFPRVINQVD